MHRQVIDIANGYNACQSYGISRSVSDGCAGVSFTSIHNYSVMSTNRYIEWRFHLCPRSVAV